MDFAGDFGAGVAEPAAADGVETRFDSVGEVEEPGWPEVIYSNRVAGEEIFWLDDIGAGTLDVGALS